MCCRIREIFNVFCGNIEGAVEELTTNVILSKWMHTFSQKCLNDLSKLNTLTFFLMHFYIK